MSNHLSCTKSCNLNDSPHSELLFYAQAPCFSSISLSVRKHLRGVSVHSQCEIFPAEYLCGISVRNIPCGISVRSICVEYSVRNICAEYSVRNTPCGILRAEYLCGILRAEYSCGIHNDLDLTSTLGQSTRDLFMKKVHYSEMRRVIRLRKVTARSTLLTPTRTHTRYPSPSGLLEFLSSSSAKQ